MTMLDYRKVGGFLFELFPHEFPDGYCETEAMLWQMYYKNKQDESG